MGKKYHNCYERKKENSLISDVNKVLTELFCSRLLLETMEIVPPTMDVSPPREIGNETVGMDSASSNDDTDIVNLGVDEDGDNELDESQVDTTPLFGCSAYSSSCANQLFACTNQCCSC